MAIGNECARTLWSPGVEIQRDCTNLPHRFPPTKRTGLRSKRQSRSDATNLESQSRCAPSLTRSSVPFAPLGTANSFPPGNGIAPPLPNFTLSTLKVVPREPKIGPQRAEGRESAAEGQNSCAEPRFRVLSGNNVTLRGNSGPRRGNIVALRDDSGQSAPFREVRSRSPGERRPVQNR
jgi:hypothetical protein